jgi:uncharacterized protein YecE (DUF72 family)
MLLYVGTSGYSYQQWKGTFYPANISGRHMLNYYGARFRAVEINTTFYGLPGVPVVQQWAGAVPAEFKFALKAPRLITHVQRLKNSAEALSRLMELAEALKSRRGPLLFQLPPGLKRDLPRLRDFFAALPPQPRVAFEFRHPSWLQEEVFALLREHQAALCIAQADTELEIPFVATAAWGYLRLRRPDYADAQLRLWAQRIQQQDWQEAFVFFKHEEKARGPQLAKRFLELAGSP